MARAGVPLDRVNPIFITHHHYDHIGDLADVLLTGWLTGRKHALRIFGPPGTRSIVAALLGQVYDKDIESRSHGALAIDWAPAQSTDVWPGPVHEGARWRVTAEAVVHGYGPEFPCEFNRRWMCLGYRAEVEDKVIAISGDSVACDGLERLARDADVLVQCCYLARAEIRNPRLERLARHTIACSDTVGAIAKKARVKKLVLTHFGPMPQTAMEGIVADVERDFDGPVVLGTDLIEVPV